MVTPQDEGGQNHGQFKSIVEGELVPINLLPPRTRYISLAMLKLGLHVAPHGTRPIDIFQLLA